MDVYLKENKRKSVFKLLLLCGVLFCSHVFAQDQTVTGRVLDSQNEPLIGVSIQVKGTTSGNVTDFDGNFSISASAGATLVFSYVGFATQEILVGNQTNIVVTMSEDSEILDEVVVVGYGTMQKRQVTSSIQSVGGGDLPIGIGGSSIATQLQGKVAGLVMSGTDSPNSGNTFQLRGMASINSDRAPLIVIDGMPGGDIRSINPEEIQSIDVLKDASAGAIYGTRAQGGVILITTKGGKAGKLQLSYVGEMMFKQAFGGPDMLNAEEYMTVKAGQKSDYGSDTDWWDAALNDNSLSHRHVVTLQGGSDDARVFANFTYGNNEGVMMGDKRKDFSGRINADFKALDGWVEIGTHVNYRQALRDQNKPRIETLLRTNPTQAVYDPESLTGWNIWVDSNQSYEDMNEVGESALKIRQGMDKWFRPDVSFKLNIKPIPGLSYRQTAAYENRQWENHEYNSAQTRDEQQQSRKGWAKLEFSKTELLNTDGYFSYVNEFGLHSINGTLGYSYFERNGEKFWAENSDFTNDRVGMWDLGEGSWLTSKDHRANMDSEKNITQRLMAYFARGSYSYDDKYMATASVRYEGSSKFAENNRWGTFWAVSGGWRLSREGFLEDVSWLNDLKLRAGYGVTGVEPKDADAATRMFSADTRWMMPDGSWAYSYGVSKNINPDLGWEEKREWNVGLDFSLFDSRLWGTFDWYRRGIYGMIYTVDVPSPPYVWTDMLRNIGTMSNQGWEFVIGGDIIRSREWNWTSNLNMSHNKTIIGDMWGDAKYHNGEGQLWVDWLHRIEEGTEVGSFHVYKHAGLDETGKLLIYGADGNTKLASNGTQADRVYTHSAIPQLLLGWSNSISYKNLSLDFTITSWLDYDVYNAFEMYYGLKDVAQGNMITAAINKNKDITGSPAASTYFISDASFVKLQNLTLGYTIPMAKYTKHIRDIKVYFSGHNLLRWTAYDGLNPEVEITGWDGGIEKTNDDIGKTNGIYPQTRTFTLGLQLNF
ncbi:MAG: TonB-dependent receptor [Tannerellaceae bacterium]|jgi:TonB-linked SusC/RagA family outer membrane protein|nr:TonB-dependent receptor [Tannerellaceae bacterium]